MSSRRPSHKLKTTRVGRTTSPEVVFDPDGLPLEGDVVGGHYRLVTQLGEGTFGRVYIAERTDVREHRVALKVTSREVYGRRNVVRELTMLAAASHPHIVQLKDHGLTEDYVWLTMPLYEGETLEERLSRSPLSLREAYEIFLPIARGVEALHERGLRHQDIKPENIFLAQFSGRLHPVLLDLGVAVEKNSTFVAGTVLYGAPEQLAALAGVPAKLVLSEKIDSYCLAATLLCALVGEGFFPGIEAETPLDIATAFEEREQAPLREGALPGLTGEPRRLLSQALSRWLLRDPDMRPSAARIADELSVLLAQERAETRASELAVVRQRRALGRARVAFGMLLATGIGALLWGYSKRETLRLAAELERARARGAEGFDKLDVCVAAHELSRNETRACLAQQDQEASDYTAALTKVREQHDQSKSELARRTKKLATCEDRGQKEQKRHERERNELSQQLTAQRSAFELELLSAQNERADSEQARYRCESALASTRGSHSECRQDLANCVSVRDTCVHTPPAAPAAPAAPPAKPTPDEQAPPKPAPTTPSNDASNEGPAKG